MSPPDKEPTLKPDTAGSRFIVFVVGFPLVVTFVLGLTLLFGVFGYRYAQGAVPIPSIIGIVVGTRLIFAFEDQLSAPSRRLLILSALGYLLILVLIGARLTNRLPQWFLGL